MRAVVLKQFGTVDVLRLEDIATPSPAAGEVLVQVRAAGVNYFDSLVRQGRYPFRPALPTVLGAEVAGIVSDVGADVTRDWIGRRVAVPLFATGKSGGYCEFVCVPQRSLVPLPEHIGFDEAVALLVQGLTALHATQRSPLAGKHVIVPAAAGGVGHLIIQLARLAGASRITAVASHPKKRELSRALGADAALSHDELSSSALDADVVFDFVGGPLTEQLLAQLRPEGELVFGALGRFELGAAQLDAVWGRNQRLTGFALLPLLTEENMRQALARLFALCADRNLKVHIGGSFRLDQVAAAHHALDSRSTMGKLVLQP
jgi:NADPH2:quinone reductase